MAKPRKPMDLLEAIMALGQDVPAPKRIQDDPVALDPDDPSLQGRHGSGIPRAPQGQLPVSTAGPSQIMGPEAQRRLHLDRKRGIAEDWAKFSDGALPKLDESDHDTLLRMVRVAGETPGANIITRHLTALEAPEEQAVRGDLSGRRKALEAARLEGAPERFRQAEMAKVMEGYADPSRGMEEALKRFPAPTKQATPTAPVQAPEGALPGPLPGIAGARTELPATDVTDLNRPGLAAPRVDLEALIQGGHGLPAEATQDAAVEQPRGGSPFSLEDKEIEMLAKRASETKKPGILDALAVLASSINPRQTPQGSMALANQLRGEPERRGAEQSLQALIGARGRRKSAEAETQGRMGLEGMRQQGATTRTGIQAASGMERTRMQQQGGLQRAQVGAQSREKIAAMPGANKGPSPTQLIAQMNAMGLGHINAERSNTIGQLDRLSREVMDPTEKQLKMKVLQDRLVELDNLKQEAKGMIANSGLLGPEASAMFMLGEGEPIEGMDPEMVEILRSFGERVNRALPR